METREEMLKRLLPLDIYVKAIEALKNHCDRKDIDLDLKLSCPMDAEFALGGAFDWNSTEEGYDFWNSVDKKYFS